jgi:hypothetical protein
LDPPSDFPVYSAIQEFPWVIGLIWGLCNSMLVLSETVLVIERNGRRDESRAEDQTGANGFERTRMAMNCENITELESADPLSSDYEHEHEHRLRLSAEPM